MSQKLKVAVIFGGQSSEHEISCISVQTIVKAIDPDKYETMLIGITKEGKWLLTESLEQVQNGTWYESGAKAVLSPDASDRCVIVEKDGVYEKRPIDVVFPVLHGMYGEDGTIQGLFEMAKIPYAGCGVLSSAVSMDKAYTKLLVDDLGIRQADYVLIRHTDLADMEACVRRVEEKLKYPVFVKPSKAGSSCGVSKAQDRASLIEGLKEAVKHDIRILVEETIVGREVECAVLGGYAPKASNVGEVLSAEDFYTYDAKYNNPVSRTDLHPVFPDGVLEELREDAVKIFKQVDGYGLARVDFFVEKETNEVVFNEINTLPGFTSISMYPMLWEDQGVSNRELVDRLIELAFHRYER